MRRIPMGRIMIPGPILRSSPDFRSLNDCKSTPERQRMERNLIQIEIIWWRGCFYQAVREFLVRATKYLLKWCPFKDELLSHVWVGSESRLEKAFSSVEYIVHRYGTLFPGLDMDKFSEQFLTYQLLVEEDIPTSVIRNLQDLKLKIPTVSMSFGLTSKTSRSQAHKNANLTCCSKLPRP